MKNADYTSIVNTTKYANGILIECIPQSNFIKTFFCQTNCYLENIYCVSLKL